VNQALQKTVQQLPLEEKLELLEFLFDSIEPANNAPLPDTERRIVGDRIERMKTNPKPAKPWREFLQELE
jgi:putative addiction module component (TIGR02574 family)